MLERNVVDFGDLQQGVCMGSFSNHPYHFVFEDGSRYLMMGYECDWLWALDMKDPNLPTLNPFLDKLAKHGFNLIILNAYAHDTSWCKGKTDADDYGPPPMYAWTGSTDF